MKTVTFFSYKGGNGRTLAATNFAVYLAKLGLKVVIMDFDLDAPGVDSKFSDFALPKGQLGLIDYILRFQRDGSGPGPVEEICCSVPIRSPRQAYTLDLIPAGNYLAGDYPAKLNELNWATVFSANRDGVAFFQVFLERIKKQLSPDVLVIDSRTGFSEIGGLCTQQLADETVILSSLAKESVKMTRHLAKMIRESDIAKSLNKSVETKIVVCRIPKPAELESLQSQCCKDFDVEKKNLFFLFSCPGLEEEEFVAMLDTQKAESLTWNYIQLFKGLDVKVAEESIQQEIERYERGLLSLKAEEAEARIREMAALFPHPEVFRRAMRFFNLRRRPDVASIFAVRLLGFVPDDSEAQLETTRFFLRGQIRRFEEETIFTHPAFEGRRPPDGFEELDPDRLASIAERTYSLGDLSIGEKVRLADILEDMEKPAISYRIAKECLTSGAIDNPDLRRNAMEIAARTAIDLGKKDEAMQLVSEIPINVLRGPLATLAIEQKVEAGDKKGAFELAKIILSRRLSADTLEIAVRLAHDLGGRKELEDIVSTHPELRHGRLEDPEIPMMLEQFGFDVSELLRRSHGGRPRPSMPLTRHPRPDPDDP
jgi:MinD-like ATPase involved in chromosome partitioning or flagellar assembly